MLEVRLGFQGLPRRSGSDAGVEADGWYVMFGFLISRMSLDLYVEPYGYDMWRIHRGDRLLAPTWWSDPSPVSAMPLSTPASRISWAIVDACYVSPEASDDVSPVDVSDVSPPAGGDR
jgi:hypothetical protein